MVEGHAKPVLHDDLELRAVSGASGEGRLRRNIEDVEKWV